jgi:hypothetical protein
LIDVALHAPALLREDGPGGLDHLTRLQLRERSEPGEVVGGARRLRRWNGLLERLQNPRQRIVKLSYIGYAFELSGGGP